MAVPLTVVDLGRIFWLRTDKANLKGFCPVSLRLTLRGHKPAEVSTGVRCRPADWAGPAGKDGPLKKSHPEYLTDTDTLETFYTNAKKAARRLEALDQLVSPQAVAALLKNPKALQPGPAQCLLEFMESELETHYKPGNRGTYESQRAIVRKLRAWHGPGRLPLADFTPKQVQAFYRSLLAAKARGGEVSNANKVVSHLAAMFRRGVKQALWGESQNPFACLDKQSAPKKKKPRLTAAEQLRVFALNLPPDEWLWRARAAWAVQFYLRGERIGACLLLTWQDLREHRHVIEYQAQKGGPHKRVRVRPELRDWLCAIERHYPGHAYVLPYLPANYPKLSAEGQLTEIKKATAVINKHLKTLMVLADIDKAISTHAARRTFASIARKVAGIAATQQFLGHTTEGMTQQYLEETDTDELDDTADDIFNSLL